MLARLRKITCFVAFVVLSSCVDPSILAQNPRESFVDGKAPASLFRLANQIWEIPSAEKLAVRITKDAQNEYLIRVGVVDSGIDLGHPDLINQIEFKIQNGKVVSAGLDTRAGDLFASPQLVNYEYYAFGAEGIVDTKIKGAAQDPLKILQQYDQAFLKDFIPKLHAHPTLKNTLFSKFNEKNFSIIGAHRFAAYKIYSHGYENDERIIYPGWKPKKKLEMLAALDFDYAYLFEDWQLSENGLPWARGAILDSPDSFLPRTLLSRFKGAKEFHEFVKTEFERFAKSSGYEKDFNQLMEYMKPRFFDVGATAEERVTAALKTLSSGLYFTRMGYLNYDPFRGFEDGVYTAALQRKLHELTRWPTEKVTPGPDSIKAAMKEIIGNYTQTAEYVLAHQTKFTFEEIKASQAFLDKFKKWAALLEEYLTRKGWDPTKFVTYSEMTPEMKSIYRKFITRRNHPFLNRASLDTSHGSHVAGIIARQSENIRIVPIRVILGSVKRSPEKDREMLLRFKKEFTDWMHEPLVVKAVEGRFGAYFPGKHGVALIDEMLQVLEKEFPAQLEGHRSTARFMEEISDIVEYAGKEQLKLLNLSLGMNFDLPVVDYRNLDARKQVKAYFDFLEIEHYKWKIGKKMNEDAPGTLFLIATGNDGEWRDARSKSGLPVDLSSPFLQDFEDPAHGLVAPNNRIKNVLGVGSLSQLDEISSYSNILISKTPMVMAHGEQVQSPIRSFSDEGFAGIWKREASITEAAGKLKGVLDSEDRMNEFLIEKYKITGSAEEVRLQLEILRDRISVQAHAIEALEGGMKMDNFLRYPHIHAQFSGTSMATPTLTGLLAEELQKKAVMMKIPAKQMYLHPDFMPEKLIELVFQKSDLVDKGSPVLMLKKWTGEKVWSQTKEEVDFRKNLEKAKNSKTLFIKSLDPNFCPEITRHAK